MPEISQEELDRLRGLGAGRSGPLGAPVGEGLAARSIADYLRGGGGGPRGPIAGPARGGGISYGGGASGAGTPNFRQLAAQRGAARDAGATLQQLQAADADNRENRTGRNARQQRALDLAWQSSPDRAALETENAARAARGEPPIQTDSNYGSRFHTRPDGSRDYNYSADGQYRGAIPEEFRNAPGDANTHDAHFNRDTGQWERGDLSLAQTFRDIGSGFTDAYGNIRSTIPQIGREVVSGVQDLAGRFGGGNAISGGGADGVGNWGAVGDFFGGIGDATGLTSYDQLAAQQRASNAAAPTLNTAGRPLSTTTIGADQYSVNPAFAAAPVVNTPPPSVRRDRPSVDRGAASARAQVQAANTASARRASARAGGGGALHGGGRNMGGPIKGYNVGGPLSRRDEENERAAVAQSNVVDAPIQQAPRVAQSGGGAGGGGGGSPMAALAMKFLPKLFGLNTGGNVPNLNGYNEGGPTAGPTPTKRVMDEQKIELEKMTWDKMEARKDWQAQKDEVRKEKAFTEEQTRKEQAHKQAMKMKKASETTNKKPLAKGA